MNPGSQAREAYDAATGADRDLLGRIALTPQSFWVGDWYPTDQVTGVVADYTGSASGAGAVGVLVLYAIPGRDCGLYSAGGVAADEYAGWVDAVATGIQGHPLVVLERMPVACLAEPPDQHVVPGLQEDDARTDAAAFERTTHRGQGDGRVTGADVDDDGHPREPIAIGRNQLSQVGQQLARQVVDDAVAKVLEQLGRRRLAATRQAAEDHDRRLRQRFRRGPDVGLPGHRPLRRMNRTVSSNRMYIVAMSAIGLTRSPPGVASAPAR